MTTTATDSAREGTGPAETGERTTTPRRTLTDIPICQSCGQPIYPQEMCVIVTVARVSSTFRTHAVTAPDAFHARCDKTFPDIDESRYTRHRRRKGQCQCGHMRYKDHRGDGPCTRPGCLCDGYQVIA